MFPLFPQGPREYSGFSGGVVLVCEGGAAGYFWRGY